MSIKGQRAEPDDALPLRSERRTGDDRAATAHLKRLLTGCRDLAWFGPVRAADVTTFGVGGELEVVVEPRSLDGLRALLDAAAESGAALRMLGAGSNVVVPDNGISQTVLRLPRRWSGELAWPETSSTIPWAELFSEERDPSKAKATRGAAERWFVLGATPVMSLSRRFSSAGLSGLEFAAGIPALFGGAVRMNAGAHGHSFAEVLESVLVIEPGNEPRLISRQALPFTYRRSGLPASAIVLAGVVRCRPGSAADSSAERTRCLSYRKATQPLAFRSAGSVFRNPPPGSSFAGATAEDPSAGWLLEQAGLKGERRGGVGFSALHANWLVVVDDRSARAADVRDLIMLGRDRVAARFCIELEPEIILW